MRVSPGLRRSSLIAICLCVVGLSAKTVPQGYRRWINEDVRCIISPRERAQFLALSTDAQRDDFVVAFWARRNPTPGTSQNEFKEEHYRRLAFANQHFASDVPGWRSDRGQIYILYGSPGAIDSGTSKEGPYEIWHYGISKGGNLGLTVKFVDQCRCGDFREVAKCPLT